MSDPIIQIVGGASLDLTVTTDSPFPLEVVQPAPVEVQVSGGRGPAGRDGVDGEKGDQGIQGIQGIQGLKGDKGDTGAPGGSGGDGVLDGGNF